MVPRVPLNPPWAGSTTKKVLLMGLMEPPFQAKELRKLLLWLTLACFRNNLGQKWIDRSARSFSLKHLKMGMVLTILWAWPQNFHAHYWNGTPLHEIVYPPLNPCTLESSYTLGCMTIHPSCIEKHSVCGRKTLTNVWFVAS